MESKNYKIVKSFISKDERKKILDWIESTHQSGVATNIHLSRLADSLKGRLLMFNQSKTELTNYITNFQTISDVSTDEVPEFILDIQKRIADYFNFELHIFDFNTNIDPSRLLEYIIEPNIINNNARNKRTIINLLRTGDNHFDLLLTDDDASIYINRQSNE
jgi:hypothetical protein